jgi:hypothetical protein
VENSCEVRGRFTNSCIARLQDDLHIFVASIIRALLIFN